MSAPARRAKVERTGAELSVRRQCELLNVARSGVYRPRPEPSADDLALMRRIDELYLEKPFYGSRRMTFDLNEEGRGVNRKRVQRLMRLMGLEGLVPRPGTSKAAPGKRNLPLSAARRDDHRAEPRLGGRHHLHSDGERLSLSGCDHRLGEPRGAGLATVEHDRQLVLRRGPGGGTTKIRQTADIQHRPGRAIHQHGIHRQTGGGQDRDLDGRPRPLHGQHLHRAAVALDQI